MSGKKRDICDIFGSVYSKQQGTKGHKKTKYSVVDESASDGYDQCGRLVIQTENDCFEKTDSTASFNSNDTTEKWMKNKTEKLGNDKQICQIDIGNDCYVVGKVFGGNMLIHIRQYARRSDGTCFRQRKELLWIWRNGRSCVANRTLLTESWMNTERKSQWITCLIWKRITMCRLKAGSPS